MFNSTTQDKILIPSDWIFEVDVDKKIVNVTNEKEKYNVGNTITYIVDS